MCFSYFLARQRQERVLEDERRAEGKREEGCDVLLREELAAEVTDRGDK